MLCNLRRLSRTTLKLSTKQQQQYRTIFSVSSIQYAKKKGGVSDEEMSRILNSVNKSKSSSSAAAKEEQELEELQALLEDEEILTKQERKPKATATSTTSTNTNNNNNNTRNKPLGSIIDEDVDIDDVEMDKMLKELGLSGRWDQYKDMINSFDNGTGGNGMNEQLIEDEGDLSYEDKNAYKLFGQNYMDSLKNEFDSPEIFNFIKNQADTKGGDFASAAAAAAVNSASKKVEKTPSTAKPTGKSTTTTSTTSTTTTSTTTATPVANNSQKKSTSNSTTTTKLSMDDISKMDLNISPEEVMKDFQNPAMKKMMKQVLGVDSEEQLQKFESDLKATLGQGKSLKDMEDELEKEMKELESLFGFAKDLAKGKKKPSKK